MNSWSTFCTAHEWLWMVPVYWSKQAQSRKSMSGMTVLSDFRLLLHVDFASLYERVNQHHFTGSTCVIRKLFVLFLGHVLIPLIDRPRFVYGDDAGQGSAPPRRVWSVVFCAWSGRLTVSMRREISCWVSHFEPKSLSSYLQITDDEYFICECAI